MAFKCALVQILRHHLFHGRAVKKNLTAMQTIPFILHQFFQRHHGIDSRQIRRNMIRIGDTDVGRRAGGDIGDHIIVDLSIVCIQPQIHMDVGIERLKIRDCLFIDCGLYFIGVIFCPKGNLIVSGLIELLWDCKRTKPFLPMASCQQTQTASQKQQHTQSDIFLVFHPFVPPLDTPAITFLRNTKNKTTSGTQITTTAAIIAGIFSRPKPFSRISCIPLETK